MAGAAAEARPAEEAAEGLKLDYCDRRFMFSRSVWDLAMSLGLKRTELQKLAHTKRDDAIILLQNHRFASAYYLAGYSIEFALKACITKQISADTLPDKQFITSIFNHNLTGLLSTAGLKGQFKDAQDRNPSLAANWAIVAEWSPDSRYQIKDPMSAQFLVSAITDHTNGVLPWIEIHW